MHDQAAADDRLGVTRIDVLAAFRTDHPHPDSVPTRLVQQVNWGGRQTGPFVTPLHQGDVDRKQRASFVGQPILVEFARGVLGVGPPLQDALGDEPVEAVGEHVASQADAPLVILEPPGAVERLAQDQPDPAFADDGRGTGYRTILVEQIGMLHIEDDRPG